MVQAWHALDSDVLYFSESRDHRCDKDIQLDIGEALLLCKHTSGEV